MQKYFFLFLSFFFAFTSVKSQSITISDDINIRSDNGYEILGRYKGNILLFRDKLTESEIVGFDEQMRNRWQKTIEYEERRPQILDAIGGKDYFSIVYKGKIKTGNVVKISRFDGSANFIDSMTVVNYGNRLLSPNSRCIYSENKKIVLIYSFEQSEKAELIAVDLDNMKTLWNKQVEFNDFLRTTTHEHILITNDASAFLIFEKESGGTLFSAEPQQVITYEITASSTNSFSFSLKDFNLYSTQFAYDNLNKNLNGIGMSSEKNKSKITGTLVIQNINNNNPKLYFHHFSDETIAAVTGKKTGSGKGLSDIKVQELAFRKDGGIVAILEEVRQFTRNMNTASRSFAVNDMNAGRVTFDYYHESLIAVSFNPDGSKHWEKVMPKKQYSQDDDGVYASYGLLKTPAGLRLIFNDEVKNETTTSEYILTGSGNINRHSLFNTSQQDILLRFRDGLQIASEEVIIPSEYRSHLRLVRVKY